METRPLTTEYLVIVERASAQALFDLCCAPEDFERLISKQSDLAIEAGALRFGSRHSFSWEVTAQDIDGKEQRFFHVRVASDLRTEDGLADYSDALRSIRKAVRGGGGHIETLWDDVSLLYSERSYPLIHASESLMRKLIAYFMLTTIGKAWISETSPASFMAALEKSKRRRYVDALHQVDFIQLGDFLFREYATREISEFFSDLDKAESPSNLELEALKDCVPKSNWDRYFSELVECTSEHLNKSWKALYDLRCAVAHNALVGRADYDRIVDLTDDLNKNLKKAIDNVAKIHVPQAEKEIVAEQAAVSQNEHVGEFLSLWRNFGSTLYRRLPGGDRARRPVSVLLSQVDLSKLLNDDELQQAERARQFRNNLVHAVDERPTATEIADWSEVLRGLLETLGRDLRWKDVIVDAIRAQGGEATLRQIYEHVELESSRDRPENWKAVVRYTLQLNSSDTATFSRGGGEDLFEHLGKGRWGLRETNGDEGS